MGVEGCLYFILTYIIAPNAMVAPSPLWQPEKSRDSWKTLFPHSNNDYSLYINSIHLWRATERS